MGRSPCCSKVGLNRGAWTASEDKILTDYINLRGEGKWRNLPRKAGLKRCGKSCRLRWLNYLRPDIKRGNISSDEEDLIIRLHKLLGNRWSLIAGRLPGRTDNEIKNYWNTTLGKKIQDNNQAQTHDQKSKKKISKIEATHKDHSSVVRTKAMRCSKTFFTPHPPSTNNIEPVDPKEVPEKTNNEKPAASEPGSPYWDSLLNTEKDKENSSNFLLDIDLGETTGSFLDFFSSDFKGVLDFNYYDIMNSKEATDTSTSSNSFHEPAPFFSKGMLDHFSSFPGDWLAQ